MTTRPRSLPSVSAGSDRARHIRVTLKVEVALVGSGEQRTRQRALADLSLPEQSDHRELPQRLAQRGHMGCSLDHPLDDTLQIRAR